MEKFRELFESTTHYVVVSKDRKEMYSEGSEVKPFDYETVAENKSQSSKNFIYKDKKNAQKTAKMFGNGVKVISVDLDKEPFAGSTAD